MQSTPEAHDGAGLSRRSLFKGASAAAVGAATVAAAEATSTTPVARFGPGQHEITLKVNGDARKTTVEPRTTLLDALRDRLDLTGSKKICDRGACGGCTVLLDGLAVNSCLTLALDAVGAEITTIEGLAKGDDLHPLQRAFIEHDALQCGFCTPGMIMSGVACLKSHQDPSRAQIAECVSGNICRCGTYTRVVDAIAQVAKSGGGR